jgi:hypothetical protein
MVDCSVELLFDTSLNYVTPAHYISSYISTDNALNVINHDPSLPTLQGRIGTIGRASAQIVSKPQSKIPEWCTPRPWDCRSLHDVDSRRVLAG